jgi:imidazolonepropionase-like amidohydrolase
MRRIVCPEWLLDGTGTPPRQGQAVVIAGGRIEAVGPAAEVVPRDGDEVVRAPGATLLPGLINLHVHLSLASDNAPFVPYMDAHSDLALALRAAQNAGLALRASRA